jgi:hypothetical protein
MVIGARGRADNAGVVDEGARQHVEPAVGAEG